jgi:FkbM family methyltransferase
MILLADFLLRKLRRPSRQRAWQRQAAPFVHEARFGLRFRLFPGEYVDSQIFIEGIYELHLLRFLRRHFRGRVMLDVGANIGNHALALAPNFDEIHCFEPNPVALERLRDNAALSGATLHIHPVGLGAADAELEFHANTSGNLGGSSFARTSSPVSGILPVRRGDDTLAAQGIGGVDLIKVDVEGFEADVLAGLSRPLRGLSFEYLPPAHDAALAVLELVEKLGRYRYNYSPVETMRLASDRWLDAAELVALLDRYRPLGRSGDVYARLEPAAPTAPVAPTA